MYRILFEIQIKGLPEELACLNKLREHLNSIGKCLGSAVSYICFIGNTMAKIMPRTDGATPSHIHSLIGPLQQSIPILLLVEGASVKEIASAVELIFEFVKGCGLLIKLVG